MFGLFNFRRRGRRAQEQMELAFARGPITDPRFLLPAPEPSTKREFLKRHKPTIKAMVTEAWRSATPEQRKRLNYPTCYTAAWEEYQTADPGTDIEVVIQEAILKCAYGRAKMGTRPSWYITGESTREAMGIPTTLTRKERSARKRGDTLRRYRAFENQYKPVIDDARKKAKITYKDARKIAWAAFKQGITNPAQLQAAIVRAGKVDKMASSGKISTAGMNPAQRAALGKPAGAACVSTAGKRAALKIMVKDPKGKELQKLVDGGSKDTLLYMLQASVSPASSSNKTRTRTILKALSKKGVAGADLRGNLKKAVQMELGSSATSAKTTTKKKASSSKRKASTSKRKTSTSKRKASTSKRKASSSKRTTSARKPAGYDAALKRRFAGKATQKDNELINRYNAKARAAKSKKSSSKKTTTSKRKTSMKARVAESKGMSDFTAFTKAFLPEIHKAIKKHGGDKKLAMKIAGYAWTQLGGKNKTRAGQKPLIKKAIKAILIDKKRVSSKKSTTKKKATTAKRKTSTSKRKTSSSKKKAATTKRKTSAKKASSKRKTTKSKARVPASVKKRSSKRVSRDKYKVSGSISISG